MPIENKRGGKRAPTTLARYGTLYKTCIEPAFGNTALDDLSQQHLTDAYARWSLKGKSGRPSQRPHGSACPRPYIRGMLNYAVRKEKVDSQRRDVRL